MFENCVLNNFSNSNLTGLILNWCLWQLNVLFISPRTLAAFDAPDQTSSFHVPSDETRNPKSISHSIEPSYRSAIK